VKLIVITLSILISLSCFANIEMRANLPSEVTAGEMISVKAEITKIEGNTKISHLVGQTLDDSIYINKIGLIERNAEFPNGFIDLSIIFLKEVKTIPLISLDNSIKLYIPNVKVRPVAEVKDYLLIDWSLPFKLPWWVYLVIMSVLAVGLIFLNKYPKMKERKLKLKEKKELWAQLLGASTEEEILKIWYARNIYFEQFPDLVSTFRIWENKVYPYFFKKDQTVEDKTQIRNLYLKFVSELPTRSDYGV